MRTIEGIGVSAGVAIGRVFVVDTDHRRVSRREISPEDVPEEIARFESALVSSIADLNAVHAEAERQMGREAAKVFLFHLGMLQDRSLVDPMRALIAEDHLSAEYAVSSVFRRWAERFGAMHDSAFTTKVNDIYDLSERVLGHLAGERQSKLAELTGPTIVIGAELTPSETAGFDRSKVLGFATEYGGKTGHTSIVARALGLPAVVAAEGVLKAALHGSRALVDGERGLVILDPDEATIQRYAGYAESAEERRVTLAELTDKPAVTTDGVEIELLGNIEFPEEIPSVLGHGGTGIGLYRTEFLYLTGGSEPTEEDHYDAYIACLRLLEGRPLTIRTVDLGADKYTQERAAVPERNPFLGLRSIRYCLQRLPMFKTQLRAILRASAEGPLKIMFPLITSVGELRHARMIVRDVMEDLAEEGVAFDREIPIGMMVEVPSAAVMADIFAKEVDFFSIGTNDLIQYTLAVDRTNERVANLYAPTHPAVIRLIREVSRAARRRGVPVSCCGESAGDLEFAVLLIGLGLRTLSVTASAVPALKRLVRSVSVTQCERVARKAVSFDSEVQVAAYLRDRVRKMVPEAFDGRAVE
ncbi:MAG: phosphoenolpyruvate--protein phosphotransferase [Phycisphaerales bacterium]|nr:MAG: phosphoenolpyruvate--protein phosphotransferase [Phycisphaerales bacterium]